MNEIKLLIAACAALITTSFAAGAGDIGVDHSMVRASNCTWLCEFPLNVQGEPAVIHIDNKGSVTRSYSTGERVEDTVIIRGPAWADPVMRFDYDFTIRREGNSVIGY